MRIQLYWRVIALLMLTSRDKNFDYKFLILLCSAALSLALLGYLVMPSSALESKILNFLGQNSPAKTIEIAKNVGKATKSDVNAILYSLQRKGILKKVIDIPPTWAKISNEGPISTSFTVAPGPVTASLKRKQPQPASSTTEDTSTSDLDNDPPHLQQSNFPQSGVTQSHNAISVLNEYAQSKRLKLEYKEKKSGPDHNRTFQMAAVVNKHFYPWASDKTKKSAKLKAAKVALGCLQSSDGFIIPRTAIAGHEPSSQDTSLTFQDEIARLVHAKYEELSKNLNTWISGRLILAGFVLSMPDDDGKLNYTVVSIGSGNRCIGGDNMSLEGRAVNDSHAEIVARRGLIRFLYSELIHGRMDIFLKSAHGKYELKSKVKFHLYISTAPCGDSAIFAPSDESNIQQQTENSAVHYPIFKNAKQGILRTKVERGEGCIPVDENDNVPTYDGIIKGERLRTMSCSDKIAKWNFLGIQGAYLSNFIQPIYMSSLTLGSLYNHGHLTRAICCRISNILPQITTDLSFQSYKINHPIVGRVSLSNEIRETGKVKTKEYSCNWSHRDTSLEILDGTTGKPETRFGGSDISRICKLSMYSHYKNLCDVFERKSLIGKTYADSKQICMQYHTNKQKLYDAFHENNKGLWMKKPVEINQF